MSIPSPVVAWGSGNISTRTVCDMTRPLTDSAGNRRQIDATHQWHRILTRVCLRAPTNTHIHACYPQVGVSIRFDLTDGTKNLTVAFGVDFSLAELTLNTLAEASRSCFVLRSLLVV